MNRARLRKVAARATAGPPDLRPNLQALSLALDPDLAAAKAEWEESQQAAAWSRRAVREGASEHAYGHKRGSTNCYSCNRFKPEPSAICNYCGDDPVGNSGLDPTGRDRAEFNRAHGYAS